MPRVVPHEANGDAQRAPNAAADKRESEAPGQRASHASAAASSCARPFSTASVTAFSTIDPNSGIDTFTSPVAKKSQASPSCGDAERAAGVARSADYLHRERADAIVARWCQPGLRVAHVQVFANEGAKLARYRRGRHRASDRDRERGVCGAVHPHLAVVATGRACAFVRETLIREHLDHPVEARGEPVLMRELHETSRARLPRAAP